MKTEDSVSIKQINTERIRAFMMKGKEGWFLIDCGTPEGYEQIKENVKKTGVDPAEIRFILGTHGHYDHVGAAHLWKQEFGCLLYLHELDREQVEAGDSVKTSAALLYGTKSEPCKVDGTIAEAMPLKLWEMANPAIPTANRRI